MSTICERTSLTSSLNMSDSNVPEEGPQQTRHSTVTPIECEPGPSRPVFKKSSARLSPTTDSIISLEFFKTLTKTEDEESFHTVECCLKEKETNTAMETTVFSRDPRTQNMVATGGEAPPPYESVGYSRQQPPSYQVYSIQPATGTARDASRTPPYTVNTYGDENWSFISHEIRNKFIQKVYMILFVQLLITFGFIFVCMYDEHMKKFMQKDVILYAIFSIMWFIVYFSLICCVSARRVFPLNFILLLMFTISMAFITAKMTVYFETYIVIAVIGITAAICLLLSLLACQMKFDVTSCTMIIAIASLILVIYGLIAMIVVLFTGANILFLIYACFATLLFCVYLMFDTQQILGGRRIQLSPEEYILGALSLYIDIVYIFTMLLCISGYNR